MEPIPATSEFACQFSSVCRSAMRDDAAGGMGSDQTSAHTMQGFGNTAVESKSKCLYKIRIADILIILWRLA